METKTKNPLVYTLCLIIGIMFVKFGISQLPSIPTIHDTTHLFCNASPAIAVRSNSNTALLKTLPPSLPVGSYMICGNGKFRIIYQDIISGTGSGFDDPVLGVTRRNCVCSVIDYIESVISIPTSIGSTGPTIDIIFNLSTSIPTSGILASAAPVFPAAFYTPTPTITPGYYGGYLYDYITTGIKPDINSEEAQVTVNFGYNYTYCTSGINDCEYDFFSLILHELTHGLGFVSFGIDNSGTLSSRFANNVFSKFDQYFLFYNNGTSFDKLFDITSYAANNGVNPSLPLNAATTNRIWKSNIALANKQNLPIYSESVYSAGTSLSHLDDWFFRSFLSPGFSPNYVMNSSLNTHQFKREYTIQEVTMLQSMGYTIKNTYSNYSILSNHTPYHSGFLLSSTVYGPTAYMNITPASNLSDLTISAVNGNTITLDLSTGIVTNGSISQTVNFIDIDGDPLTIFEPHPGWKGLYNIRGCGNGGNNSNQLSINSARNVITFVPRNNFIGRAQFAFHLYDGKQRGEYVVFTVDVSKGSSFVNTPSNELLINGNFEEGTEMRTVGVNEFNIVAEEINTRYNYADGKSIPDGAQYISSGWNDLITRNSNKHCLFDFGNDCFDNCSGVSGAGILPVANIGDRYMQFVVGSLLREYFNVALAEPILPCTYQLEADINITSGSFTGTPTINFLFHNQGINNNVSGASAPTLLDVNSPLTVSNLNTWTHLTIPFTYTSSIAAPYVQVDALNFGGYVLIDNLSVKRIGSAPSISITPAPISMCLGQTNTITASGASSYLWSNGATTNSIVVTPTTSITYTVVGTNTITGCSVIKPVPVTVNTTPTVAINNATICAGTSTVLSASGAMTYNWSNGGTTANVSVSPSVTTIYTVTGSNGGCSNSKTVTVTVMPSPSLSITTSSTIVCSGATTSLNATGAITYTWSNGATTNSINVAPTTSTIYTLTGSGSNGCVSTKTVIVNINPLPSITTTANPTLICSSQNSTLTASGANTYTWSTGATSSVVAVTPIITTNYTVTGQNITTGCKNTQTVSVSVIPYSPIITTSATAVAICSGGSSTITASGVATYTWNTGANTSTIAVTPSVVTTYTVSGNYSLTGCGTGSTSIVVNPVISTLCCTSPSITIGTSLTSSVNMASGSYTVSGTVIDMQGTITFTANTSFSGYTLRMKPNTTLKVYQGTTLTLTNCKLFSCSELWNGIYLLNDAVIFGSIALNNTTIEDMYNGIVADYGSFPINTVTPYSSIVINGSTLNKNYISLQLLNSPGVSGSAVYPLSINTSTVSSNASSTSPSSALKPSSTYTYAYNQITNGSGGASAPYLNFPRAFTGIVLNNLGNTSPVIIGDSVTASKTNTFDNLDFGIRGSEATIKVHNNYFKNITGSVNQSFNGDFYLASGPDEIGIAIAMTHTSTNVQKLTVGTRETLPSPTSAYPKGNVFEDCNKAVKALSCKNVYIKGNAFNATSTSTLVTTATDAYYYYKNQQAVWVSALADYENLSYNYIRNFANGIYSSQTLTTSVLQLNITYNDIKASSTTGYCKQAIQISQVGGSNLTTGRLLVANNGIANVYNGILSNGLFDGLNIYNNSINIEDVIKTLGSTATSTRIAVKLTSSSYGQVRGNSITCNVGATPTTSTAAVYLTGVHVTGSTNTRIECNNTFHIGRDFVFQGACGSSSWKTNTMSDSYRGLEMYLSAVIGQQGGTGSPNLSANTWTTVTEETYVNGTNPNSTSQLYILNNVVGNPKTLPTSNYPTASTSRYQTGFGMGLQNLASGTSYTCNLGYAQRLANGSNSNATNGGSNQRAVGATDSLAEYTYLATANETTYEVFADEMMYQNKQWVYKLIEQDSINPANGSTLDNFYDANQNTAIDKLTEAQIAIANFDISAANSANNSAPVSKQVEQKCQRANELTLKFMNDRYYNFTSTERIDLVNMANECPVKGAYVAQSRNLIDIITHNAVSYDDNCEVEANASRKAKTETSAIVTPTLFNLFPNPNNGSMQLDYNLGGYDKVELKLYDVTGKLIFSKDINNNEGSLIINEQNLYNGVYFYHILVGKKSIKTDKIVIIK